MPIIKQFEGFNQNPYLDSVKKPTIGYGTIEYPDGKAVTMNDPAVTAEQAEGFLSFEMSKKSAAIAPLLQQPATLHQAAAMLSLTYNIGVGAFQGSTVLRDFNAGNIPGAADAFLMWDKGTEDGQKVVIPGLHNRRVQERTIFLTADA
jgi:lysozyme